MTVKDLTEDIFRKLDNKNILSNNLLKKSNDFGKLLSNANADRSISDNLLHNNFNKNFHNSKLSHNNSSKTSKDYNKHSSDSNNSQNQRLSSSSKSRAEHHEKNTQENKIKDDSKDDSKKDESSNHSQPMFHEMNLSISNDFDNKYSTDLEDGQNFNTLGPSNVKQGNLDLESRNHLTYTSLASREIDSRETEAEFSTNANLNIGLNPDISVHNKTETKTDQDSVEAIYSLLNIEADNANNSGRTDQGTQNILENENLVSDSQALITTEHVSTKDLTNQLTSQDIQNMLTAANKPSNDLVSNNTSMLGNLSSNNSGHGFDFTNQDLMSKNTDLNQKAPEHRETVINNQDYSLKFSKISNEHNASPALPVNDGNIADNDRLNTLLSSATNLILAEEKNLGRKTPTALVNNGASANQDKEMIDSSAQQTKISDDLNDIEAKIDRNLDARENKISLDSESVLTKNNRLTRNNGEVSNTSKEPESSIKLTNKSDSFIGEISNRNASKDFTISFKENGKNGDSLNRLAKFEQISMSIKQAVNLSKSEIKVNMHPRTLGAVDITIEFARNNSGEEVIKNIKILAENKSTLEILEKSQLELQKSLAEVQKSEDSSLEFDMKHDQDNSKGEMQYKTLEEREKWMEKFSEFGDFADDSSEATGPGGKNQKGEDILVDVSRSNNHYKGYITHSGVNIEL